MSDELALWFSTAIDLEVVPIRAAWSFRRQLRPRFEFKRDEDVRKGFITEAPFHIINQASVDDVEERMKKKHPNGLPNWMINTEQFRPNVVIDYPKAYGEDDFFEMRIGPVMMRFSGPCWRCNTIRLNWDKCCRVEKSEPYSTLAKFRTIPPFGIAFGTYYQMEILDKKEVYESLLPKSKGY